jgi:PAS domain S-box-containing protein
VRRSAGSFVVTFIGLCLLFGAAILALLELFVLSRLGRLGQDVRDVGAGPGRGQRIRVQGRDEIGRLAQDVNVTLEALHQQQERFRDVAFCSADWVWEVDAQGRYTYCSDHVREVLGYEPEEVLGRTPFDLMPEDERARIGPEFAALAAERRPVVDMENRNLCKDGREVLLLTNGVPILDDAGNLLGYRGVDKDITEKKRAEAALRESEERYRGLFNQNLTAVFRSTLDGCSRATRRSSGCSGSSRRSRRLGPRRLTSTSRRATGRHSWSGLSASGRSPTLSPGCAGATAANSRCWRACC